jgi:hypothetical protein
LLLKFNLYHYNLLDEFVDAVKRRFGDRCIIQFEAGLCKSEGS